MSFYTANNRRIYFMSFGDGAPVLLLHGISNSGRAWGPQIPALVASGYRVIVPDLAGHGASGPIDAPIGVDALADDIEALIDDLGLSRLDVVGLSLGGMVAMTLALRHPGRIDRLVIADSFNKTTDPAFREVLEGWAQTLEQPDGPVTRFEKTWPGIVSPTFQATAEGVRTYQVWHGIAAKADGPSLAHVARGIAGFDLGARVGELAMPTLFLAGSLDQMSPPDLGRYMAEQAPQGTFALIEGAAHLSNVDAAGVFTDHLLAFFDAPEVAHPAEGIKAV